MHVFLTKSFDFIFRPELMRSRVLELNASDERGIQVCLIRGHNVCPHPKLLVPAKQTARGARKTKAI